MAAALLSTQDSANQVGGSFVTQYYNMLHQHPDQVYQFYKEESTMTRIDGNYTETSNGIIEIHSIISKLKFSSIEIKTANFLKSLMGGIMIMVSGLVQAGQYEKRRKFIQSFFLATQETGYFILNDFFHYVDEEYFCTPALLAQGSYENVPVPETGYSLDIVPTQENEIVGPTQNGDSLNYDYSYQNEINETLISSFNNVDLSDQFIVTTPLSQEPIRHTYASILKSKVEDCKQIESQLSSPFQKSSQVILDQQFERPYTSLSDKSNFDTPPENNNNNNFDYEVEAKSVFVKNVTVYLTEADLENEFKKFGKIKPDGVAIRSHKETGKYYAFVEYEDTEGVQNALKAAQVDIDGWRVYVEQRKRPKNAPFFRGRGRGRGGRFNGRGRGRFRVNGFYEDEDPNPLTQAKQYRQKYQSY